MGLALINVVGSTIARRKRRPQSSLHAGRRSAVPAQALPASVRLLRCGPLHSPGRFMSQNYCQEVIDGLCAHHVPNGSSASTEATQSADIAATILRAREMAVRGPRLPLPHRSGRRAEAQGHQLHSRRGACPRRDEARPHRFENDGMQVVSSPRAQGCNTTSNQQHRRSPSFAAGHMIARRHRRDTQIRTRLYRSGLNLHPRHARAAETDAQRSLPLHNCWPTTPRHPRMQRR